MNKKIIIALILALSFGLSAQEEGETAEKAPPPPPLDPAYMGVHGMKLMVAEYNLYASHLPLYSKPHDAQIIYSLKGNNTPLILMVRDAEMVTFKPKPFNLQRMMRGESFTIKGDVYLGHFERDGFPTMQNVELIFEKQIYYRELKDLEPSSNFQKYDTIKIGNDAKILVHQIQQRPSYDHIVYVEQDINCVVEFYTSSAQPSFDELFRKLYLCGPLKPFHLEYRDFQ